jgi:hypothetical protein
MAAWSSKTTAETLQRCGNGLAKAVAAGNISDVDADWMLAYAGIKCVLADEAVAPLIQAMAADDEMMANLAANLEEEGLPD